MVLRSMVRAGARIGKLKHAPPKPGTPSYKPALPAALLKHARPFRPSGEAFVTNAWQASPAFGDARGMRRIVLGLLLSCAFAAAQPVFEVASIKPAVIPPGAPEHSQYHMSVSGDASRI